MSGGTLDADNSLTVSGALTQSGNITIDVADTRPSPIPELRSALEQILSLCLEEEALSAED